MSYLSTRLLSLHMSCNPRATLKRSSERPLTKTARASIAALGLLGFVGRANAEVLHHYSSSLGQELTSVIAVSTSKLLPLVPTAYTIVPASALLVGRPDQGIVALVNFRGFNPTVDQRRSNHEPQITIDLGILVAEPAEAAAVGLSIPGAFHFYTLAILTNDNHYAASLHDARMPANFINKISYQRSMNDATGVGDLAVRVPAHNPLFFSLNTGQGYALAPGALNAAFWHDGQKGKAVLSFSNQPFRQGNAISQLYTRPHSPLDTLVAGEALGPCPPDPNSGYSCIITAALNFRYDQGTVGKLQLVKPVPAGYRPFPDRSWK